MTTAGNIAIIPARGGSKRLPGKNLRPFCGRPIIEYSIEAAIGSGLFSEVMVSTDDGLAAAVAAKAGAKVPFMRSPGSSGDSAGLAEVVSEVLGEYARRGSRFSNFCLILATAPFVTPSRLRQVYELMLSSGADTALPVVRFSYPVQRALRLEGGRASMMWPENYPKRSQDLPAAYHDSGQFYWGRTEAFLREKKFFSSACAALEVPELEAEDIDTEDNFMLAELKFRLLEDKKCR
ncbi:MAG TPA: pseudaminic acid cytidylyltransferase [Elusimicrobiales bacterium]|nr:pseudaminic acid cytidylyltransferase [Elusimicrobiales bacterium]